MEERYIIHKLHMYVPDVNCYILACRDTRKAVVIDPGGETIRIIKTLERTDYQVVGIINTHCHYDHVASNLAIKELTGAPIMIHEAEAEALNSPVQTLSFLFTAKPDDCGPADILLKDGDRIPVGNMTMQVIHTPGHSAGCIMLRVDDLLFTGDTLFRCNVGRCDFPGGDLELLRRSLIEKVMPLDVDLRILPGHDAESVLWYEIEHNPYMDADIDLHSIPFN